ncbi:PD-(D/E)XK nuclease family protein [Micromonospora sp. CB01531]|uniref:PD-(D/E)XK nuclease family protein n=1 Tax=Micromonospora sp. CB01531 TaxID=1718947 RepID=UPI00094029E9|nr:PD-(D/E)XK nuclease family protein [Micromonospora sp. CB01531]
MSEARRYTRSFSQLSQYAKCSEEFRLNRMVRPRLPSRPASWLAGGIAIQSAADDWERTGRKYDLAGMFEEYYWREIDRLKEEQPDLSYWMKPPRTKTVEKDIENRLNRGLESWVGNYLRYAEEGEWEIWNDPFGDPAIEVECTWTFPSGVSINMAIDRILYWPKADICTIEDLKSGNRVDDPRQLGLYLFVANRLFEDHLPAPIQHARFWYFKDGVAGEWETDHRWTEEYLDAEYSALDRGIQNRVFIASPSSDNCGLCGVKEWCRLKGYLREDEDLK